MAEIYLRSGSTTATIRTDGAQIVSFKGSNGREVMWQADPEVWPQHSPVLFPTIGTSKDNQVSIDGVVYPMAKHGLFRYADFEVFRKGKDFVDLVGKADARTHTMYPFDFEFHVIHTLRENGFTTTFVVDNLSDKVMPFTVGGHPAFIVPMEDGAQFTDYQLVFEKQEDGKSLLVTDALIDGHEYLPLEDGRRITLDHAVIDPRDTLIFSGYNSRSLDMVHKVSGHGLRISYPKMEVLAVWSAVGKCADYVCLEPWHGLPAFINDTGRFEDKPFVTLLQPGMSHQCGFDVDLI